MYRVKMYVVGLEMVEDIVEIFGLLIYVNSTEERCLHKKYRLTPS